MVCFVGQHILQALVTAPFVLSLLQTSACLFTLGAVLTTILVPLSLSSVEYNEYGLVRQRSTGEMHLDKGVHDPGRYALGPDFTFKTF